MNAVRFGKHAPKQVYCTVPLKNYLAATPPAPPGSRDRLKAGYTKKPNVNDPTVLFPMDGNDRYGECTIAALAHTVTVFQGMTGKKQIGSQAGVEKLYFHPSWGLDAGLAVFTVGYDARQLTVLPWGNTRKANTVLPRKRRKETSVPDSVLTNVKQTWPRLRIDASAPEK